MSTKNINDEIKRIIDSIWAEELPGNQGEGYLYSKLVKEAFDDISALKSRGFRLSTICRRFSEEGKLPKSADPNTFRRAFARECARREMIEERMKYEKVLRDTTKKEEKVDHASSAQERKMPRSGRVVNTGTTRILKKSDGSFEVLEDDLAADKEGENGK